MGTDIQFIISVCFVGCFALESPPTKEPFDIVQAAVFSRVAYPLPGTIPVLNRKVFRGKRVTIAEHPYVASIRRSHVHYLTGAILSMQVVITVAHPIYNVPLAELAVVTDQCYNDRTSGDNGVMLVVMPKEFDPYTLQADLALLRLNKRMLKRATLKPIPLFGGFPRYRKDIQSQNAWVTGWGRCDWTGNELCLPRSTIYEPDENQDPMLKTIWFNHSMLEESPYCIGYKHHKTNLGKGMLCVGTAREEEDIAPCLAVPGAPLTVLGGLVGLASWGFGCGYTNDLPLVYTDLRMYRGWLNQVMRVLETLPPEFERKFAYVTTYYTTLRELEIATGHESWPPHHRPSDLQAADLDFALVRLDANVTDFRDYIYNGTLSQAKAEIYESIKIDLMSSSKQKVSDVSHSARRTPPPKSFLSFTWLTPML